ncbi:hypothetical protein ACK3TF_006234 [Chlorella vulgaris]
MALASSANRPCGRAASSLSSRNHVAALSSAGASLSGRCFPPCKLARHESPLVAHAASEANGPCTASEPGPKPKLRLEHFQPRDFALSLPVFVLVPASLTICLVHVEPKQYPLMWGLHAFYFFVGIVVGVHPALSRLRREEDEYFVSRQQHKK